MKKGLVFGLTLILFSCGVSSTKNSEKLPLFEVLTQQSDGGANIRFFEILTEPNEVKMLENDANLENTMLNVLNIEILKFLQHKLIF